MDINTEEINYSNNPRPNRPISKDFSPLDDIENGAFFFDMNDSFDWIPYATTATPYKSNIETNAFDVAVYILKELGEMTSMKLHKLLYYCQAWSLVWDEQPIFQNEIEAWSNGPVVRDIFAYHKGSFLVDSSRFPVGNSNLLTEKQRESVRSVLEFYGNKSSQWLIDLTHMEKPWKDARKGLANDDRGNQVISWDSMSNYYSSL